MPSQRQPRRRIDEPNMPMSEPELVMMARPEAQLYAAAGAFSTATGTPVDNLNNILEKAEATMRPLFGVSETRLRSESTSIAAMVAKTIDLALYYKIDAPSESLEDLAANLRQHETVLAAYVKPPSEPPLFLNDMVPIDNEAPPVTADFSLRQGYLDAAPAGIDARHAWTRPGGSGTGVRIIDIEGAWRFSHEDLIQAHGGVVGGTESGDLGWRNHGTAVIGEFGGDRNAIGVTGICPDAVVSAVSIFGGLGSAAAIRAAANRLSPGDIILIELHRPGPRHDFASRNDQLGYIAVEWWQDDFDAIQYAIARGVIVVEAAGNGAENLDDSIYNTPAPGFPASWRNPFNRTIRDSGAIIVGAGAPPPNTHGRNHGPDRSRLDFSNHGLCVDAQGWGREVTTAGYGDLQGGSNEDLWYTDLFSGTSSASPIVVGAVGCLQGILRAHGRPLLTPQTARNLLRSTGSPQQDAPGRPIAQRIGNRPNLRQAIDQLLGTTIQTVALHRYWNGPATDHFYTTNWSELGGGAQGWDYEGIACYVFPSPVANAVPLYRYWNPSIADHFYTTNWSELGGGAQGWRYEGIQGWVMPNQVPGTVPLFRYWGNSDHFYTTNWSELGGGAQGWRYEGIACYVYMAGQPPEALSETAIAEVSGLVAAGASGKAAPLAFVEKAGELSRQGEVGGSPPLTAAPTPGPGSFMTVPSAPTAQPSAADSFTVDEHDIAGSTVINITIHVPTR